MTYIMILYALSGCQIILADVLGEPTEKQKDRIGGLVAASAKATAAAS